MEKKNTGLVVAIIILVVLLLGLGGYFCYEKGLLDKFLNKESSVTDTTSKTRKNKYDSIKIISNENDDKTYIIGSKDGKWEEIVTSTIGTTYFGEYNNKVYYADDEAFKYIDLNGKSLTPVTWLKYEETYQEQMNTITAKPWQGFIKDGIIYFLIHDKRLSFSIRYLSTTATKYSDITKIAEANNFDYNIDNNAIYYSTYDYKSDGIITKTKIMKLDMKTKEKSEIYSFNNNTYIVNAHNGKVLLTNNASKNKSELYLYDLETKERSFLTEVTGSYMKGAYDKLVVDSNTVYYLDDSNIMKYENGNKTKVYEYSTEKSKDYFTDNCVLLNKDSLVCYSNGDIDDKYIINKKEVTESQLKEMYSYKVTMKDNSQKTIYDDNYSYRVPYDLNGYVPF